MLKYLTLLGNLFFILFIGYNAIDEGFQSAATLETRFILALVLVLILNSIFLWDRRSEKLVRWMRGFSIGMSGIFIVWVLYRLIFLWNTLARVAPFALSVLVVLLASNIYLLRGRKSALQ